MRQATGAILVVWLLGAAQEAGGAASEFTFEGAGRAYEGLKMEAAPVEWGPIRVRLEARSASLTLTSHRLTLWPLADGSHGARLAARGQGRGILWAGVEAFGLGTEQSDPVILPEQEQELVGRVRVAREADRYRVTPLALPKSITVQVRSGMGERLAGWCEGLPLPFLEAECGGLRRVLSTLTVPLPRPGETYDVARSDLTPEERRVLDAYLDAAASLGSSR
ncbi:MAG: hypothetical protein AB1578_08480 [Thermodesulfobacteriota bacterium]